MPDSERFGDRGAHTLKHTGEAMGGLRLPHLEKLGLGWIDDIPGVTPIPHPIGFYGKMAEVSDGKDTTTGHWEMAGCPLGKGFALFPHGFPKELIHAFCHQGGLKGVLGNIPASGTEIIEQLGEEHMRTGYPIVYTSGDSVFQIAAHEEILPLSRLYEICQIARRLSDPYRIGRVIARPFVGSPGAFKRTAGRRDYAVPPPKETILDLLLAAGLPVIGVGKISDIFSGKGVSRSEPTKDNVSSMKMVKKLVQDRGVTRGLIFANLVDFDMLYGHRRDPKGYAGALETFDRWLGDLLPLLRREDWLFITADHGCDPTASGTDHTREYVPILGFGPSYQKGCSLGIRKSFSDLAATLADLFGLPKEIAATLPGESFMSILISCSSEPKASREPVGIT